MSRYICWQGVSLFYLINIFSLWFLLSVKNFNLSFSSLQSSNSHICLLLSSIKHLSLSLSTYFVFLATTVNSVKKSLPQLHQHPTSMLQRPCKVANLCCISRSCHLDIACKITHFYFTAAIGLSFIWTSSHCHSIPFLLHIA